MSDRVLNNYLNMKSTCVSLVICVTHEMDGDIWQVPSVVSEMSVQLLLLKALCYYGD